MNESFLGSAVPPMPNTPTPMTHKVVRVTVTVAIALVVTWGMYAFYVGVWPISPAKEPTTSESSNPAAGATSDPMSEWKTYTNTHYGFEIQYPGDYSYDTSLGDIVAFDKKEVLSGSDGCGVGIGSPICGISLSIPGETPWASQSYASMEGVIKDIPLGRGDSLSGTEIRNLGSREYSVVKRFSGSDPSQYGLFYLFEHNNTYFEFFVQANYEGVAEQILATFRPIDSVLGWKAYTDSQNGFEVRYPQNWTHELRQIHPGYPDERAVYFGEIDPATGDMQFDEGTGGFNVTVVKAGAAEVHATARDNCAGFGAAFNVADPIFADRTTIITGKSGWQVDCNSEYGSAYTVTVVPLTTNSALRIETGLENQLHKRILATLTFTVPVPVSWKPYSTVGYNFEFMYPADRTVVAPQILYDNYGGRSGISLGLGDIEHPIYDKERFELEITDQTTETSIEKFACSADTEGTSCFTEYRMLNGNRFVVTTFKELDGEGYGNLEKQAVLIHKGSLYKFYTGYAGLFAKDLTEARRSDHLFDQILATFRFKGE